MILWSIIEQPPIIDDKNRFRVCCLDFFGTFIFQCFVQLLEHPLQFPLQSLPVPRVIPSLFLFPALSLYLFFLVHVYPEHWDDFTSRGFPMGIPAERESTFYARRRVCLLP